VRQSGLAGEVMLEVYNPVLDDIEEALSFVIRTSGEPAHLVSANSARHSASKRFCENLPRVR